MKYLSRRALARWLIPAAVAAATGLAVAMPVTASAATGPALYASCATNDGGACAGEVATGTTFNSVTASAFTRDPDLVSSITNGLGWQVGLKDTADTTTLDAIIGISDSSPANGAGYSPSAILYKNGALVGGGQVPNEFWCPADGTCAPASQGGSFPVGDTVTLSVSYNKTEGTVNYDASDQAGNFFKGWERVGHAAHFGQARIEAGYGTFAAPATTTKLVGISAAGFTSTAGANLNFRSTGVTRQLEFATSDGTSAGTKQAGPGTLNKAGNGFSINFLP